MKNLIIGGSAASIILAGVVVVMLIPSSPCACTSQLEDAKNTFHAKREDLNEANKNNLKKQFLSNMEKSIKEMEEVIKESQDAEYYTFGRSTEEFLRQAYLRTTGRCYFVNETCTFILEENNNFLIRRTKILELTLVYDELYNVIDANVHVIVTEF